MDVKPHAVLLLGPLAVLLVAGCPGRSSDPACAAKVAPLVDQVASAIAAHQACTADADCHLVDPTIRCALICPVGVNDPKAVQDAMAAAAAKCPDCTVSSVCPKVTAFCNAGACDTCQNTGTVGDRTIPGDTCWDPPAHRCSDVDTSAPAVWACPPPGSTGDCCRYDRGCLPCGWSNCATDPTALGCATLGGTDGGTACPVVPHGTICFDADRFQ